MKAVIITHGIMDDGSALCSECRDADFIICADGGTEYAYKYSITPDYIIGDLDSAHPEIIRYFENKNVKLIKYPCYKDFTDTELCVYKAKELGCSTVCIAAGTGDRIDHSLGNIGLLHIMKEMSIYGYILFNNGYIYLCWDKINIKGKIGDVVSIIPFYNSVEGLNSKGLKYKLDNLSIPFGKPRGVSNVMTDNECSITIDTGEVLVIKQNNV